MEGWWWKVLCNKASYSQESFLCVFGVKRPNQYYKGQVEPVSLPYHIFPG